MSNQAEHLFQVFLEQFPLEEHSKNEIILSSNSSESSFFFIETGAVKMMRTSKTGQNLVLHIFYPGACFPLLTLVNDGMNKYDFSTLAPTSLRRVDKEQFTQFLKEHNEILFEFQLRLLKGIQGLLNRIEQSTFIAAYNQVAGLLLYFFKHFQNPSEIESSEQKIIHTRLTHQEISDWLGLSRENVSIQMKLLERNGIIQIKNKEIEIIDLPQLQKLADPHALV